MKEKINGGGQKKSRRCKVQHRLVKSPSGTDDTRRHDAGKFRNVYKNKDIDLSETVPVVVRVRGVGPRFVVEMIDVLSCKVSTIIPPLIRDGGHHSRKKPPNERLGVGSLPPVKIPSTTVLGRLVQHCGINSISNLQNVQGFPVLRISLRYSAFARRDSHPRDRLFGLFLIRCS